MVGNNYWQFDSSIKYPPKGVYNPVQKYPEYPFHDEIGEPDTENQVYEAVRNIFVACGFDVEHFGQKEWNPLGKYISPGNVVLLKPNLVKEANKQTDNLQKGLDCMITHPSIVRVLFDYVYLAMKGVGKIIIADAPVQGCDFEKLKQNSGYDMLFQFFKGKEKGNLKIDIADLRDTVLYMDNGRKRQQHNESGKYEGMIIDIGSESYFSGIKNGKRFRVTDYAAEDTTAHHCNGKNEYCISRALLDADVVLNIVKPKTHRIAGYTAALKNMIGICTKKEYLPHHRQGRTGRGGDEYESTYLLWKYLNTKGNDIKNWALKRQYCFVSDMADKFSRRIGILLDHRETERKKFGFWYGNDTIWRTILDVNHIVYYAGKDGRLHSNQQRRVLHFGDMIVCGEKEGPLLPAYKMVGGILFSDNPVEFDYCAVKLMGFDYRKIPTILNAVKDKKLIKTKTTHIALHSNDKKFHGYVDDIEDDFAFKPSSGWNNYL